MKYIITESKLEKAIIHFLTTIMDGLESTIFNEKYVVFHKDHRVYMVYYFFNNNLFLDASIWDDLRQWFGLSNDEYDEIILKLFNKKYGFKAEYTSEGYLSWDYMTGNY